MISPNNHGSLALTDPQEVSISLGAPCHNLHRRFWVQRWPIYHRKNTWNRSDVTNLDHEQNTSSLSCILLEFWVEWWLSVLKAKPTNHYAREHSRGTFLGMCLQIWSCICLLPDHYDWLDVPLMWRQYDNTTPWDGPANHLQYGKPNTFCLGEM